MGERCPGGARPVQKFQGRHAPPPATPIFSLAKSAKPLCGGRILQHDVGGGGGWGAVNINQTGGGGGYYLVSKYTDHWPVK
jgi:hypothetical protein